MQLKIILFTSKFIYHMYFLNLLNYLENKKYQLYI